MPHWGFEGVMGAVEGKSTICEGLGRGSCRNGSVWGCRRGRKGIQRLQDVRSHSAAAWAFGSKTGRARHFLSLTPQALKIK